MGRFFTFYQLMAAEAKSGNAPRPGWGKTSSPDPLFSSAHSIAPALNRTLMCTCRGLRDLGHPKTQVPSTPAGTSQDLGKTMGEWGSQDPKLTPSALPFTLYAPNRVYTGVSDAPECIARVVGGPSRPHPTPAGRCSGHSWPNGGPARPRILVHRRHRQALVPSKQR